MKVEDVVSYVVENYDNNAKMADKLNIGYPEYGVFKEAMAAHAHYFLGSRPLSMNILPQYKVVWETMKKAKEESLVVKPVEEKPKKRRRRAKK